MTEAPWDTDGHGSQIYNQNKSTQCTFRQIVIVNWRTIVADIMEKDIMEI